MAAFARRSALAVCVLGASLAACATQRPLSSTTQLAGRAADELVLHLPQACSILPGGTPMGRPEGVRLRRLSPGDYLPILEDDDGVYFASPEGVVLVEPGLRGTSTRPGGIYVPLQPKLSAFQYLGDADGIATRERLPSHCRFQLKPAAEAGAGPS